MELPLVLVPLEETVPLLVTDVPAVMVLPVPLLAVTPLPTVTAPAA